MDSEYQPNENINTEIPSLDSAYESLLANRENLFTSSNLINELTEEDVLCNKNLQTSYLFKTLNDTYTRLNKQIECLVDDEKSLDESVLKFQTSHSILIILCKAYSLESIDGIHKKYMELAEDYRNVQIKIRKEIVSKRVALEASLDDVSTKLNSIRKLVLTGVQELVKPEDVNKKMCPVCFEREVCMVMVPCGHTYCDACSKYDYRAKCPQCRQTINSRVKMYFSM